MGLLDNNLVRTQGRELRGVLLNSFQGTFTHTDKKIDCRGYNSLLLTLRSVSGDSDIEVYGFYRNTNSTATRGIKGINISRNVFSREPVLEEITKADTNYKRYLIDVSVYDYIGIAKPVAGTGYLTCEYTLTQNFIYDSEYLDKGFTLLQDSTSTTNINSVFQVNGTNSGNAILYRLEIDEPILNDTNFHFYKISDDGRTTVTPYYLNKLVYPLEIGNSLPLSAGVHYFAIPIEENTTSVKINMANNTARKKLSVKKINFEFPEFPKKYTVLREFTGVYSNKIIPIPDGTKTIKVVLDGGVGSILRISYQKAGDPTTKLFSGKKVLHVNSGKLIDGLDLPAEGYQEYLIDMGLDTFIERVLVSSSTANNLNADIIFEDKNISNYAREGMSVDMDYQPVKVMNPGDTPYKLHSLDLKNIFENDKLVVYKNEFFAKLSGVLRNIVVWNSSDRIYLSQNGILGERERIDLNAINFPNLMSGSSIEHVVLLPWARNSTGTSGRNWRMNVITTKGQIYHNFPSRAVGSDGIEEHDDYKKFDESVVWEIPERWHPVKTNTGSDADLINTGKYKYFPALPDEAYEFHPAINQDNGYGNGGFPAVFDMGGRKLSRFYFSDRNRGYQSNPMGYMGGFAPHPNFSVIGTYKSNTPATGSTRIGVFLTQDGGRNWFCRYEFGAYSDILNSTDEVIFSARKDVYVPRNLIAIGMTNIGSGIYNVKKRSSYAPDEVDKEIEKTKKFKYGDNIAVSSITQTATDIVVTTAVPHGFEEGALILFEKQNQTANEWDWIVNTGHTALSAGDGVLFKAKYISDTSFRLMECVYNPHNNLVSRHIHSVNRCKDGYMIGAGEAYPEGWILWMPLRDADSVGGTKPWENLQFIRINSTKKSIQRPLGVVLKQEPDDDYVYIGVDNDLTDIGFAEMPEGRTDTFRRSSQGVWKGKLIQVDNQADFQCLFDSDEVCYFFKDVRGTMIYIGQRGHVGVSTDRGKTWTECHLNTGDVSRYGGYSSDGYICIDNFIFKTKQ